VGTRSIITLTTDFGTGSPYVAQMKGVILSIDPEAVLIDVTHAISPQDVRQGALVLEEVAPRFPKHSIHLCVVDPGVGTERKIVCAEIGGRFYIAPDNGLLSRLAANGPVAGIVALTNRAYWLPSVSATFHGRDILAPVAAHLSLGVGLDDLGEPVDRQKLVQLDWQQVTVEADRIVGAVISIDAFGNLITNIGADVLATAVCRGPVVVHCAGQTMGGISRTYAEREPGSLVALVGSGGKLEIAVVNGNAAQTFQGKAGDAVIVALARSA
jgi:S-adenosylmethionine hydrolase